MASRSPTDDQRLLDFRNATNFRSVKRADPSIIAILETSVYSVIYHYDERSDRWEKQKQEGPLFVVKRQTVKNPAIPLVPGEMKLTTLDDGMLQVARRGDRHEIVQKFRTTVLDIVGEPSKRPEASFSPTSQAPQSASSTVAPSEDGLSKLFAGLMKPPTTQTSVQQQHILPQQDDVIPTSLAVPAGQPIIPRPAPAPAPALATVPSPTQPTGNIQASVSVPFSFAATQVATPASAPPPEPVAVLASAPAPAAPEPAKYETADDLLASILGTAPPAPVIKPSPISQQNVPQQLPAALPQYRQVSPLSYGSSSIHQASSPVRTYTPQKQAYGQQVNEFPNFAMQQPDLTEANVRKSSKIGDATFAQAAQPVAANSASIPTLPMHALSPSSRYPATNDQAQTRGQYHARSCSQTSQKYSDNQSNQPTQHAYQRTSTPSSYRNGAESRAVMAKAVVDATVQKEQEDDARVWGIELDARKRKLEFRRRLVDLMMTDEMFMDNVWVAYLERMSAIRSSNNGQWNEG
ncbi:hypothetical protein I307_04144 [Cryptococcus deuterogattii 99/473]|uniref:Uncharacterized protein n=1 Tax=Cryptococcus deuterogattii Ram5 TaxID=1296110 RepID=A0A0D0V978_9TREE|nr:hypothetical protein I309_03802 [Cryptococcus deuterogattii LA55]KIR43009.1 hypothetical protein I313_01218 [Cryptococcus deuterogattii Ram5]KIR95407.1 hypothetical protein I304_00156 [Cryptococcus deuterogattii CBS 10090]KIY56345.1 hypothetical protein I307_04144 [Cryptococcus deuterogattii 99/473]